MKKSVAALAALSLVACASAPESIPAAAEDGRPLLHDVTPDGGRVSNANGQYAGEAADIAQAHCGKTGREMRVTGITVERNALIFSCVAPA